LPPLPTLRLDPASEERELEHVVRRALQRVVLVQKHPRLGLLVVLQLVSADGGVEGTHSGVPRLACTPPL